MLLLILIAMIAVELSITSGWFWGVFILSCIFKVVDLLLEVFLKSADIKVSITENNKE